MHTASLQARLPFWRATDCISSPVLLLLQMVDLRVRYYRLRWEVVPSAAPAAAPYAGNVADPGPGSPPPDTNPVDMIIETAMQLKEFTAEAFQQRDDTAIIFHLNKQITMDSHIKKVRAKLGKGSGVRLKDSHVNDKLTKGDFEALKEDAERTCDPEPVLPVNIPESALIPSELEYVEAQTRAERESVRWAHQRLDSCIAQHKQVKREYNDAAERLVELERSVEDDRAKYVMLQARREAAHRKYKHLGPAVRAAALRNEHIIAPLHLVRSANAPMSDYMVDLCFAYHRQRLQKRTSLFSRSGTSFIRVHDVYLATVDDLRSNVGGNPIVMVPICDDGQWFLICVDVKRSVGTVYNSKPNYRTPQPLQDLIDAFLQRLATATGYKSPAILEMAESCPRQDCVADSGIIMCHIVMRLSDRRDGETIGSVSVNGARHYIPLCIMRFLRAPLSDGAIQMAITGPIPDYATAAAPDSAAVALQLEGEMAQQLDEECEWLDAERRQLRAWEEQLEQDHQLYLRKRRKLVAEACPDTPL